MRKSLQFPGLVITMFLGLISFMLISSVQSNTTNDENTSFIPTTTPTIPANWKTFQENYADQFAGSPHILPVRGNAADWWADIIIGQPDFSQITPNEVVGNKLFNPGGVYVDRSAQPDRVYIYDAGNSRILGLSHLGLCIDGQNASQACSVNSDCPDSSCQIDSTRSADIVLGQPGFSSSTCNGDSNFQNYPDPPTPTANTLCGLRWEQVSITEGGSMVTMTTDSQGNLYVPDFFNNRILRYDDPFTTDNTADHVWGQSSFNSQECNRGASKPNASSLCLAPEPGLGNLKTGVAVDAQGSLWVADTQNNRILRFPFSERLGVPDTTADLVLGQPDFSSNNAGEKLNQMNTPTSVRVDTNGVLYVAHGEPETGTSGRVLVFHPPFTDGMAASILVKGLKEPTGLELAPDGSLWVNDSNNEKFLNFANGTLQKTIPNVPDGLAGGLGVDSDGNILATGGNPQQVLRFSSPEFNQDVIFLSADQWGSFNKLSPLGFKGFSLGLEVTADQLIVGDSTRLLFWNGLGDLSNHQPADGVIGQPDFSTNPHWGPSFGRMRADQQGNLWVIKESLASETEIPPEIQAYTLPLSTGQSPHITITSPIPLKGGGSFTWDWSLVLAGIDTQSNCDCLWLSDEENHRVFRIRDITTNPTVDIILGQLNISGIECNQGRGRNFPSRDSLCHPGALAMDNNGNLFVADNNLEYDGNLRLLEWDANLLPSNPSSVIYGIPASRVFGRNNNFTRANCLPADPMCAPWEPAFDSLGNMVIGFNSYLGPRFPRVYNNPLSNPLPVGKLNDFHSMPLSARFDSENNLYILDHNRNRVLIYLRFDVKNIWLPIIAH
jgi:sugar lactone lactonase YvrE